MKEKKTWSKQLLSRTISLATACCLLTGAAGAVTFTDVPGNHWAKSYIEAAADKGYVSGVGSGKFNPEASVSGVEFVSMIMRAFYPEDLEGREVKKVWYDPYLYAALDADILSYTSIGFTPYEWSTVGTQPLNRYEVAMLAFNGLRNRGVLSGLDKDTCVSKAQSHFTDWDSVPDYLYEGLTDYYRYGIAFCYATGVLSDTGNGAFEGAKTVSRAQACSILIRMDEAING